MIFHDAVRRLVSQCIISDYIKTLEKYNAVDVGIETTDTINEINNDLIQNIPDRNHLNNGQTPQAFKRETIRKAYDKAQKPQCGLKTLEKNLMTPC